MSPQTATVEILQSQSLATAVRQELERRILAGEISPDDKLTEQDVAEALKVSRGPVCEAFRALYQAGLVPTEKNRGVFARSLTHFEADELCEVRAGLDSLIGRLAAERCTPAGIQTWRSWTRSAPATRTSPRACSTSMPWKADGGRTKARVSTVTQSGRSP